MNKQLREEFEQLLKEIYRKQLSENIKKGLKAKKKTRACLVKKSKV